MSTSINYSFWKPPPLKGGEYDWWAVQFESHTSSLNGQMWKVIEIGDEPISAGAEDVVKNKSQYSDADWKVVELNSRAKKMLHSAMSPSDLKKMVKYKTAKEIWDALKRLYGGNGDVQRNRILAVQKDYDSAAQGKSESLDEFHSRFQGYVGQLEFLGEDIPDWKITHQFLQGHYNCNTLEGHGFCREFFL